MNFEHLKKHADYYTPIIALGHVMSHKNRKFFERFFFYLTIVLLFLSLGYVFPVTDRLIGSLMLSASLWVVFFAVEAFYYSFYFASEKSVLGGIDPHEKITYELSEIIHNADENHITQGFLESKIGLDILLRLGITEKDIDIFFSQRKSPLTKGSFVMEGDNLTLGDFAKAIVTVDEEFNQFLMKRNIKINEFIGASMWVERMYQKSKYAERWWGIDSISHTKGIGKKWSYGNTALLEQYGRDLGREQGKLSSFSFDLYKDEIDSLEAVLAKDYEANALLVSEYGVPKIEVVSGLAKRIVDGSVLGPLEHKRIVILDSELLIANNSSKAIFENEFIKIMNESVSAGNIILMIDDLPALIASTYAIEVDISSLMDDYISKSSLQVIAMSDKSGFEKIIRPNERLMKRFEAIRVLGADEEMLLRLLEDKTNEIERHNQIFFTYQAISAMVLTVERYFIDGTIEDKVADFLSEITPRMVQKKKIIVTADDIYTIVTEKTGVPVGEASVGEKQKLGALEEVLSRRVVGQKEALSAISNAMRRNRSGISNPNRPVGSFLFLGPTGVGKTETSKALAEAVFGNSKKLLRLDMSEFNTPDSLNRLIGTVSGDTGILTTMLRENPHGVLLLDEFEKTDDVIQNLFLQILDEGIFSDAQGKKVNARNILFIATSNAGSDIIWDFVSKGGNLQDKRTIIIDEVVRRKIFKPELVNRFDGTILFSPLGENELRAIASLMLQKLKERMRDQGINFVITNTAIDLLVKEGSDPQFGARPLNRAIQDKIESVIAKKIISGELGAGMTYEFKG